MDKSSEVHAYRFIYTELTQKKDWSKEQVYSQQEALKIKPIKEALGLLTPENVVKIGQSDFYIIEAKNERKKINKALKEAREYADLVNKKGDVRALLISGIAGNESEGFVGKSEYFVDGRWQPITENEVEITGLLSKAAAESVLKESTPNLVDIEISNEEFLKAAERINNILHKNSINKDYRARFISALLLALSDGSEIDLDEETASVLIGTINAKVDAILQKYNKRDFSRFIKIDEPSSPDNHVKVRAAIVSTVQELLALNIRSAMRSGKDILGQFYEVFLKYGNGAREIGIVLTPRHITRFAAEVVDVQPNDLVLDPACGTGGFLVAAFDQMKKTDPSKKEFENFRMNGLYGVEEQDPIVALAMVNMIFRGDGKNNMIEGNTFNKWLSLDTSEGAVAGKYYSEDFEGRIPPITKVLMNPPFSSKSSQDKEHHFIEHALKQMQPDGVLFAVLPISVMIEGSIKEWRRDLLNNNTLLSVVTFPVDLFYPAGTNTLGIFVRKGVPHPKDQRVLWVRAMNDGHVKKKGKRLISDRATDDIAAIQPLVKSFVHDPVGTPVENIPEFQKASVIDFSDDALELVPEVYLDDKEPTQEDIEVVMDSLMKETVSYLIRTDQPKL